MKRRQPKAVEQVREWREQVMKNWEGLSTEEILARLDQRHQEYEQWVQAHEPTSLQRPARRCYGVVIEQTNGSYSGYVPDLPGCTVSGPTAEAVQDELKIAIRSHLDNLERSGQPIPTPTTRFDYIEA